MGNLVRCDYSGAEQDGLDSPQTKSEEHIFNETKSKESHKVTFMQKSHKERGEGETMNRMNQRAIAGRTHDIQLNLYQPKIGDIIVATRTFLSNSKKRTEILEGTIMTIQRIDSKGDITVYNQEWEKHRWIVRSNFVNIRKQGTLSRERDVLRGHEGWVWCCAISHNDEFIVSGSKDNKIKIWESSSGNCVKTFEGHSSYVTCVCISNDDRYIISASNDNTIRVWDRIQEMCKMTLKGHKHSVWSCVISSRDDFLVSCSYDGTLKVWDFRTGEQTKSLEGHENRILCCDLSAGDEFVVSGSQDKDIIIWDLHSSNPIRNKLSGHTDWVRCVQIAHDDSFIVSGSYDKTLRLWNLNGDCLRILRDHSASIRDLKISNDKSFIVSASGDSTVKLWRRETGACYKTFRADDKLFGIDISHYQNSFVVAASKDNTLRIWSLEDEEADLRRAATDRPTLTPIGRQL